MNFGRLILRLAIGSIFIEHGTQKLFGWFGGHGPEGTARSFESLGLRPGRVHALAAGTAESGGGLLLVLGAATPAAAAAVSSVMVTALRTAVWRDGIKIGTGDYELLLLSGALALADLGPGDLSIDALAGTERRGARWAVAALGAAVVGSSVAVALGRKQPPAESDATADAVAAAPA
jgi:putative oxidoreductase